MLMFSSRQQMLPCNIFSEQAVVINGGEGEASPKNRSKLAEQIPDKVTHSSKGVKHTTFAATNGNTERTGEGFGSPKHEEVPLPGRRFNDTAVSVPIKKRKIQMVQIIRSPSPPPRSSSPVADDQSFSRCISPVLEHGAHNITDTFGDASCDDNSIDISKSRVFTEGNIDAKSLGPNLYSSESTKNVTPEDEDMANAKLLDESKFPQKEHPPCRELLVNRTVDGVFTELTDSRMYSTDICAQKAADDREVISGSFGGQKCDLPMNNMGDKAGVLSNLAVGELLQIEECLLISSDDRGTPPESTSGCARDDRLHWDLNRDMDAWEQTSDKKLRADNLLNNKDDVSRSVNSSFHQCLSGKSKTSSENTVDEAISKNDISVVCYGQSEVDEMKFAHVSESFDYDAYDEEDEQVSDTDKHPPACIDEDQAGAEHQMLNEYVGDGGEEHEVEEHVDYGDSDCREADDMAFEGDEKMSITLQAESDWKFEEVNGAAELHLSQKCASIKEDANTRKLREQYGMYNETMEEDGELLPQLDGAGLQESDNRQVDHGVAHKCPGKALQKVQEFENEKVLQLRETNIWCKDLSGNSEVQYEIDKLTSESSFQKYTGPSSTKSTGWDQLPEGFHTVEEALKAVKGNTAYHRATSCATASRPDSAFITLQGLSTDGRHGSGALRGISSRVDGSLGDRSRPYEFIHGRENSSRHRRLEGGFDPASKFLFSKETVRGRSFGRGSDAGRFRVDPWMDSPRGQWGSSGHRCSPSHYIGPSAPNSRGLANAATLAAAKVQSSGFIVAPDGTIIKAGSGGSTGGRSGMHTSGISRSHAMPNREPSIDPDIDLDFQTGISMPLHRSTAPRSKLARQTPSPPPRNEEDRSNDRQCKRLMSRVYTPSRKTSPYVAHGTALIGDRGRQNTDVNQRVSPKRPKQSEQTGKQPLRYIGRPINDDLDNRRFKRDHDAIGRFSGSYRGVSPKSTCYRDGDRRPAFDSRREQSREDERREEILHRDVRHITGFRHTGIRNFDDDVPPRRRRLS